MSTQPVPTFPEGYEILDGKSVEEIIAYILNNEEAMKSYNAEWQLPFAKSEIAMKDEYRVAKPSDNPIVNEIWNLALNQTDIEYASKLFYICGVLL